MFFATIKVDVHKSTTALSMVVCVINLERSHHRREHMESLLKSIGLFQSASFFPAVDAEGLGSEGLQKHAEKLGILKKLEFKGLGGGDRMKEQAALFSHISVLLDFLESNHTSVQEKPARDQPATDR